MLLNRQEIFDKVVTHLFAQGVQSLNKYNECQYRGQNGTSCAVGCLIPDEEYDARLEYRGVRSLGIMADSIRSEKYDYKTPFIDSLDEKQNEDALNLLLDLQFVHDHSTNWTSTNTMRFALAQVLIDNQREGIDTSILNTLSFKDR